MFCSNCTPSLTLFMGLKNWNNRISLLKKLMFLNRISWCIYFRYCGCCILLWLLSDCIKFSMETEFAHQGIPSGDAIPLILIGWCHAYLWLRLLYAQLLSFLKKRCMLNVGYFLRAPGLYTEVSVLGQLNLQSHLLTWYIFGSYTWTWISLAWWREISSA